MSWFCEIFSSLSNVLPLAACNYEKGENSLVVKYYTTVCKSRRTDAFLYRQYILCLTYLYVQLYLYWCCKEHRLCMIWDYSGPLNWLSVCLFLGFFVGVFCFNLMRSVYTAFQTIYRKDLGILNYEIINDCLF